jgi:DDE superfamily endonuclease
LIETAHQWGEKMGLAVWNEDEAGPYQAIPQMGSSWQPEGKPACQPHEYIRGGTAKMLTLLHPATGEVRIKGVTSSTNAVLHPWLLEQISSILSALPPPTEEVSPQERRVLWEHWQEGLSMRLSLPDALPPLRMLLILDNLVGHKSESLVTWLLENGVMPLYTPVGGSWLNMAESIQRVLTRRALSGQHPQSNQDIIDWLEAVARAWNRKPTPFVWGGKRKARRDRAGLRRRHALGGSGACSLRVVSYRRTVQQERLCA